jgi:hypothetical protein
MNFMIKNLGISFFLVWTLLHVVQKYFPISAKQGMKYILRF